MEFNAIRDQIRRHLHSIAHFFGETTSSQPESLKYLGKAKEALKVDSPYFLSLLPYESITNDLLFVNKTTAGFALEVQPSAGADESLVKALADLIKNKIPPEVDCTVMLYKHRYLAEQLKASFDPIIAKGGVHANLAELNIEFHKKAILKGYPNNRNIPAQLADYRSYFFFSQAQTTNFEHELHRLRADIESELKVAGFCFRRMQAMDLQVLLRTIVSPNPEAISWPAIHQGTFALEDDNLRAAIPDPSLNLTVNEKDLEVSIANESGERLNSKIVNCTISAWPERLALWQNPDLFANLLRSEHGIFCPFIISMTFRGTSQEKMKSLAKRKAKILAKNSNAVQTFLHPGIVDEARNWQTAHESASKDQLHLLPVFYNLILFTDEQNERSHVAKAVAAYRQLGFTLQQADLQLLSFLASLPFLLSEGLFTGLKSLGLIKTHCHFTIANLLPIVADFKGSRTGVLLPTFRHQLSFLDTFDDENLPITNYNRITVASSGAGKSQFEQAQIKDGLARGQIIFVIDVGDSYKHLCKEVGGTYINATNLALNPFTLFDFEGSIEIGNKKINNSNQIRDLISVMANPNKEISEVQASWIEDAILDCWKRKGNKACMDDVLESLRAIAKEPVNQGDRRFTDLIQLLKCYGSQGKYGHIFNPETKLLNDSNFVVLEMGKLDDELLKIVMFVMIVIIQGQFYHSDRAIKKRCIIDEAWRFLGESSNTIAAQFLNQGFRTARKHNGGFAVIIHSLNDLAKSPQGEAIDAASDTKIIMRQGNILKYIKKYPDAFSPLQIEKIKSFGAAKEQGFSEMMITYGQIFSLHRYFEDPYARVLFSTSGEEHSAIDAALAQGIPLKEAVKKLAQKYEGEVV